MKGDVDMFNIQLKRNIKELDKQIGELMKQLAIEKDEAKYEEIFTKVDDLTKVRKQLSENKVNESNAKEILLGAINLGLTLVVLKHERTEVITSKAFGAVTKLFRG